MDIVTTIWNWSGKITSVNENRFKFGQGVNITRFSDGTKFSIHPTDIKIPKEDIFRGYNIFDFILKEI